MKLNRNPFLIASTAATLFLSYTGAQAAGIWVGTIGNFDTAANWDNNAVPASINTDVSNNGTIQVNTNHVTNDILAGTVAGKTGTWDHSAGTVSMAGGWFRLGTVSGATGTYKLSGSGILTTVGRQDIGEITGGTGVVDVSGNGTWTNNGAQLAVGGNSAATAGGNGTLNLSGTATINNNNELWIGVGSGAVGVANLNAGTVNNTGWLAVGRTGGTGTMNLAGATYNKTAANAGQATIIGASGPGTVNQNAGAFNVLSGETWIGETNTGVWNISGGTATLGLLSVGQNAAGNGTFTMQGATGATGSLANGGGNETVTVTTLRIGNNGTATGVVNLDGGTLTAGTILKAAGTGTFNFNGGKLRPSAASATFMSGLNNAFVKAGGAVIDTQAFDITIPQSLLTLAASPNGGLTKQGTAVLTLSGANTFTGDTVLTAGTLVTGSAGALGGSTLNYNNQGGTLSFGTITATTFGGLKGSQNIALTNTAAGNVALSVGANNQSNTYSGVLSGGGSLIKTGALAPVSSLTLSAANTFTGNVTASFGAIIATNSGSLGVGPKTIDISNGTAGNPSLHLDGSGGSINLPANFTYSTSNVNGTIFNDAGDNSIAGQINLIAGGGGTTIQSDAGTLTVSANIAATTAGRVVTLQGSSNGTVSGVISNGTYPTPTALPVTKAGLGTWTLSGANTYTGATTVNAGTLRAGSSSAFGVNSPVVFGNGFGAILDLNGFNTTVGSLGGGVSGGSEVALNSATLTVGGLDTASTFAGVLSGNGGLTKVGVQALALTYASTYTGATAINAGTLTLDATSGSFGSLGETAVTVGAGGTLQIKGDTNIGFTSAASVTSNGTISLQDGTINQSVFIGGALNLNTSSLNFDLSGDGSTGSADQITANSVGTVAGTRTINLNVLTGQSVVPGTYTLITAPGGLGSGGAGYVIGTKPAGFYNYSLASSTPTALRVSITGNATPGTAYWTGKGSVQASDTNNKWASGSTQSNWSTNLAGTTDPLQVPGLTTNVIFTANNATSIGNSLITQMDAAYSIKSLTFNTATTTTPITAVTIDTNGKLLTLGSGGLTSAAAGLSSNVISGSGSVALLESQTWANNNNTKALSVTPNINSVSGATTLTLAGTGTGGLTLGAIGSLNGSFLDLVCDQAGVTTLAGNNTFVGGVLISQGTLKAGDSNPGAMNTTTPNTLTFSPTSTGVFQLNGNSLTVASLSSDSTSSAVENNFGLSATLTDNVTGATTFAGVLRDGLGGGTLSLVKTGAGSLALTNTNTFTGALGINAGTLRFDTANSLGSGNPVNLSGGGTLQFGAGVTTDITGTHTLNFNGAGVIHTNGNNVTLAGILGGAGGGAITKTGTGELTLTGGTAFTAAATNFFVRGGTLTLSGASEVVTASNYSSIGQGVGDRAILNVANGAKFTGAVDFNVGDVGGTNLGEVDGGIVNLSGSGSTVTLATVFVGKGSSTSAPFGYGVVNQAAGTTLSASGNAQIGAYGLGQYNLNGGVFNHTGGYISVARQPGSFGVIDINGGTVNDSVAGTRTIIGELGVGVLNVRNGGILNNTTSGNNSGGNLSTALAALTLGNSTGATGIVNLLPGGTINTTSVGGLGAGVTSVFNFNGGTLATRSATATFMQNLTAANVFGGGAVIDTALGDGTIAVPLVAPAGNGVATITATGSGFSTVPMVQITDGGGTGATAVATIDTNGNLTGVTVTNPGTGYTSAPTVTITGPFGTQVTGTATLNAANVSGSLTKNGANILTLTKANTYTGNTIINAGTLQLGNGTTGNDGTLPGATVTNNGTLAFNRFGADTYAGVVSGTGGLTKLGAGTQTLTGANTYTGVTNVGGGVLSVATIGNGGAASNIGAATADSANLVFNGNGSLLYTGTALVTARGYTVGTGGGIDHAADVTFAGQILSSGTGSFTKNGTGTLNYTYTGGTNALTGGNTGNTLGYVVNNGLVNLGGTAGAPLAQTNTITGELIIGTINTAASPNAEVRINGGTTNISSYIGVGRGNGTNNAVTTLSLNNNAVVTGGNFAIGYNNGVAGYLSSPVVNFNGSSSFTDSGVFTVGESTNAAGGISTVNVTGTAAVTLTTATANAINIGATGTAVMNQSGGSVTAAGAPVTIARDAASVATYNLNAGTLTPKGIAGGAGTSTFNFNGGSVVVPATNATFIQTLTRANVRNGGAVINTNGFDATVAQALVHSDVGGDAAIDGGLTKNGAGVLTLTGANAYTGSTTVNAGTLAVNGSAIPDAGALVVNTAVVNVNGTEVVSSLYFGAAQQAAGTWGATGSGAAHIDDVHFSGTGVVNVTNGAGSSPYSTWASSKGLVGGNALGIADPDNDGVNNLLEFIAGGEPNPANPNAGSTPAGAGVTASGGSHIFAFRRAQVATTQPGLVISYEYGSNLAGWTAATNGVNGITINSFTNFYGGNVDKVEVSIPDSLAPVGVRFARMRGTQP